MTSMKLSLKAHKLANADVQYLSLVERGANRAPFKIQKTEKPMFNLDRSLSRIMKGDSKPEIIGYVISKEDNVPEIEKALKEAGVKVDAVVVDGDVLILKQADVDLKSPANIMVKFSPEFMVVCKGVSASGFGEVLKTQGFMPGPDMAARAFTSAVNEALVGADAVTKIDEATDEFHGYLTSLAASLPQPAFKAYDAFLAAKQELKQKLEKPANVSQEAWDAMTPEQKQAACDAAYGAMKAEEKKAKQEEVPAKKDPPAKKEEEAAPEKKLAGEEPDEEEDEKPKPAPKPAPPQQPSKPPAQPAIDAKAISEVVATAMKAATADLIKQFQSVDASVRKTQESLSGLAAQVADVRKDAASAKALAAKTDATLRGTVLAGDTGNDPEDKPIRKAEGEIGAFDTAFNRNVRKSDRAREIAKRNRMI
jgi:outer membrane biosynthesis protein TonB